jgi:1-phosphatidylinositol-3-phosphate 5-kinase
MCSKSQKEHLILLTNQLLAHEGLSSKKWADLLLSLAKRVTHVVRPDVKNDGDDMDIRKYVQIKKVISRFK